VKLDTNSGTRGGRLSPVYENLADSGEMDDAVLTEVVAAGRLTEPSGLALHEGVLYVTDHATTRFHAFDLNGQELRTLETGLPAGTLAGLTVGRDGRIWFVDMLQGAVYRLDPQ
jgi:sugar lactone lactonase YvrE